MLTQISSLSLQTQGVLLNNELFLFLYFEGGFPQHSSLLLILVFNYFSLRLDFVYMLKSFHSSVTLSNIFIFIWVLYSFFCLYFCNVLRTTQRYVIAIVQNPIQREFKLSDELYGAMTGPIFSIFHSIFGIIISRFGDLYSRKYTLLFIMLCCSISTFLHGVCQNYSQLIIARILLAISISPIPPLALSLIHGYVSEKFKATSVGLYNSSIILGMSMPYILAFFISPSNTPIGGGTNDWRYLFYWLSLPSVILSFLLLFIREEGISNNNIPDVSLEVNSTKNDTAIMSNNGSDEISSTHQNIVDIVYNNNNINNININEESSRPFQNSIGVSPIAATSSISHQQSHHGHPQQNISNRMGENNWTVFKYILQCPSLWLICFIGGFSFMGSNALNNWTPEFFRRVHGLQPVDLAKWMSWISPCSGIFGSILGGLLTDRLKSCFGGLRTPAILIFLASITSFPFQITFILVNQYQISLIVSIPALIVYSTFKKKIIFSKFPLLLSLLYIYI